jgi:hypothetical protein
MEENKSNTPIVPNNPVEEVKPVVAGSVLYVHGRRVIIILTILLFIIVIIGILYYNGKMVYETGI